MARNFRNQRSQSRPNRSWARLFTAAAVNVPAASKVLIGGFSLSIDGIDETVLRSVGRFYVASDAPTASESQIGAFGMILISDAAQAIGVTAVPGPITDASDDGWFTYMPIVQSSVAFTSVGIEPIAGVGYDFDSKAKRVFDSGRQIAVMVENAHATHAFNFTIVMRLLGQVRGTR